MYKFFTSNREREFYRIRFRKQLEDRKRKFLNNKSNSALQTKLNQAGLTFLNALHYQSTRFLLMLYIFFYYVFVPYLGNGSFNSNVMFFLVLFFALTEPILKYSLINILLDFIINRNRRAKILEMFTLFDILKAELNTLKPEQEVNVYSIIKNVLPMFKHIQSTLTRFLSLWKRSPKQAKQLFHDEIKGDSAKVLSDILFKMDQVTKSEALDLLNAESSVFSTQHFKGELQKTRKKSTAFYSFFLFTNILTIAWLVVYLFNMFNDRMGGANVF